MATVTASYSTGKPRVYKVEAQTAQDWKYAVDIAGTRVYLTQEDADAVIAALTNLMKEV